MYLVLARRTYMRRVKALQETNSISCDVVGFDCSRVAAREVLCVHLYSHGDFIVAPLSVLPDQHALLDASTALGNLKRAMLKKTPGTKQLRIPTGTATKTLCLAVMFSMSCMLPYPTSDVWMPITRDCPTKSTVRLWDSESEQWYNWDSQSGAAHYCLCPSLWSSDHVGFRPKPVKVLLLCGDEGSQGYSLWWFLMSLGYRTLFHRDPAHRISNAYNNALRGIKTSMSCAMNTLLIHKFRRGPWGSGRFMREMRETLQIVRHQGLGHPMLLDFLPQIARDNNLDPDELQSTPGRLRRLLDAFISSGHCQRVETRRWWTLWGANLVLDGWWHVLLCSLCIYFFLNGVDPFELALELKAKSEKQAQSANEGEDDGVREFKMKYAVLQILLCEASQNIMRSQLVIFRRLRYHHSNFIERHTDGKSPLSFHMLWSTYQDSAEPKGEEKSNTQPSQPSQPARTHAC